MYLVYCPFPNLPEAQKAARDLVEGNFSCCVNILKSCKSIYKWKGKLEQIEEYVLIAKCADGKVEAAEKKIKEIHPHTVPAIIRIRAENVNKDYEDWCNSVL